MGPQRSFISVFHVSDEKTEAREGNSVSQRKCTNKQRNDTYSKITLRIHHLVRGLLLLFSPAAVAELVRLGPNTLSPGAPSQPHDPGWMVMWNDLYDVLFSLALSSQPMIPQLQRLSELDLRVHRKV